MSSKHINKVYLNVNQLEDIVKHGDINLNEIPVVRQLLLNLGMWSLKEDTFYFFFEGGGGLNLGFLLRKLSCGRGHC